ncbi:MAG TPA: sulfur carrier protein ThiS [Abditibacteriaceae bacterium]|jgi:sulfur carrier protein
MNILLNGKAHTTTARTVGELLHELATPPTGIAVAINDSVVRRAELDATALNENDRVEVIRAVQGG